MSSELRAAEDLTDELLREKLFTLKKSRMLKLVRRWVKVPMYFFAWHRTTVVLRRAVEERGKKSVAEGLLYPVLYAWRKLIDPVPLQVKADPVLAPPGILAGYSKEIFSHSLNTYLERLDREENMKDEAVYEKFLALGQELLTATDMDGANLRTPVNSFE